MRVYEIDGYEVKVVRSRKKVEIKKDGEKVELPIKICRDCTEKLFGERPKGRVVGLSPPDNNSFTLVYTADYYYFRGGMKCGECGRLKADLHFRGIYLPGKKEFIKVFGSRVIPLDK